MNARSGGTYAAHHYDLEVTGDYELVAVSIDPNSGTATSTELHATDGDGTHWYLDGSGAYAIDGVVIEPALPSTLGFCWLPNMPLNISGAVIASGTMTQPGRISIGGWCTSSNTPSWSYEPLFELLSSPMIAYTTDVGVDTATWSEPLSTRVEAVDVHTWSTDASSNITAETITATTAWLAAHHDTSLGFDRDIPGYDPSWAVDVTAPHTTTFTVRGNDGYIGYATTQTENH